MAVSYYKVGMELYYAAGNEIIKFLKDQGKAGLLGFKTAGYTEYCGRGFKSFNCFGRGYD
jgi:orotidine-5'-phosphate decarboxylase